MISIFNIVYQNGELASEKCTFFGVTIDTIFTVFTTIIIFFLGYIFNKKVERDKENNRMKELEGYFLKLIELLDSPIKKQIDSFVSLSEKLKKTKEQNYNFQLVASFNLNLLKEISNLDLYKIFVSNKQGKIKEKTSLFEKLRNNID